MLAVGTLEPAICTLGESSIDPAGAWRVWAVISVRYGDGVFECFFVVSIIISGAEFGSYDLVWDFEETTLGREGGLGVDGGEDELGEAWLAVFVVAGETVNGGLDGNIIKATGTFAGRGRLCLMRRVWCFPAWAEFVTYWKKFRDFTGFGGVRSALLRLNSDVCQVRRKSCGFLIT